MKKIVCLSELKINEKGIVERVEGFGAIRRRLFDMGVTKGAKVELKKVAPLGDPIQILIRGYDLSLRKKEANYIFVEVDE